MGRPDVGRSFVAQPCPSIRGHLLTVKRECYINIRRNTSAHHIYRGGSFSNTRRVTGIPCAIVQLTNEQIKQIVINAAVPQLVRRSTIIFWPLRQSRIAY